MKYKGVIIERNDIKLNFTNPVKVTKEFDNARVIGLATVREEDGKLVADIETDEDLTGLFPAIGFTQSPPKLYTLGFSQHRNIDEGIEPIK